ncbi:hypothetical protein FEE95_19795 [Maribacter algarum]|uniref:Adhesin domain-containing protein n=1 Tax=Maribacter algarum (ex Zhang et al. 2020) TaxID=2578118 RepID=A0A5S3PIY4_9FLAO|nr:hypothetical protein [Maribacter algarum]TMM53309.1 hypothetical protein FEE95_19795 [Maribacter algarum]
MNKSRQTSFKMLTMLLCFIAMGAYGQKQTKTFKETFNVSEDAVLEINTSHADIEFETWSKNEVEIEAIIEIEDATNEEAEKYFENSGLEILGNSKKVSITSGSQNMGLWQNSISDLQNFHIEMPKFPELHNYSFDFDFDELSNIPVPPMAEFDHEAFKKDGDKYIRQWKKDFDKSYDEEHVKKLEEWAKRMEEKQEKLTKKREEMMEKRAEMERKRGEKLNERMEKMAQARAKRMEAQNERRERFLELRTRKKSANDSTSIFYFNSHGEGRPNIFYGSHDGLHKNYKVKKTIKVKMPKGMKIKMNVRHGEVKLAGNTMNLNAILSHSSLWAAKIDGVGTKIDASYTPINVKTWYYGQLQTKYSEDVALEEVFDLKLNSTSSNVMIERLVNGAFIKNDFGPLEIKSISNDFKDIDITLQNAEFNCATPDVPFTIYVNGTSSKFSSPENITLNRTQNFNNTIHRGYFKNKNSSSSININSKFSEVIIE